MKIVSTLIALLAAAGPARAAGGFTLVFEERDGLRTLAVSDVRSGALAAAMGSDDLRIVDGAAAQAIIARLSKADACGTGFRDVENPAEKPRVVIHKMDYEEDLTHAGAERETRIAPRDRFETGAEILRSTDSGMSFAGETEDASMISADEASRMRITRITGADAAEATRFIDEAGGLDANEKSALKKALGL